MALEVVKPNIRKMFVPDPDHFFVNIDVKQGDAQVVAWEAQDEKLMDLFEAQRRGELRDGKPIDIHSWNALDVFSGLALNDSGRVPYYYRKISKSGVHGTNYAGSAYEIAHRLGIKLNQMQVFQHRWFHAHPAIPRWHKSTELELMRTRSVTNILGYRRIFFGRVSELLPEALAWKPQSTVALVINAGIRNVERTYPFVQTLLQVHDSALYQVHRDYFTPELREGMIRCHLIELPYKRPLTMGVDLEWSETSWGECHA
jgi:DNA polymerase I-like protein with 3'-5' exonuclease and polymerase domains